MNCHEFERRLNERWDQGLWDAQDRGDLERHASTCVACGDLVERYAHLAVAVGLQAREHFPTLPATFTDRVLAEAQRPLVRWRGPRLGGSGRAVPMRPLIVAVAASLLAVSAGTWWLGRSVEPGPVRPLEGGASSTVASAPIDLDPLEAALAEARAATLELATQTSAPALRLGRQLLASAPRLPDEGFLHAVHGVTMPDSGETATPPELVTPPIPGSARDAFRFLLGPMGPATPPPSAPERET